MPTLQQEQQPIDEAITHSVLQSIPADWTAAVLTLGRHRESSAIGEFSHSLVYEKRNFGVFLVVCFRDGLCHDPYSTCSRKNRTAPRR
jgi:hypothetical protein